MTETRLRADRDFVRYWSSRQISLFGSLVTMIALPVLIYRISHSPGLTALTTLFEGLPYLVFGLFAGALSDRWDRQRVMVVTDVSCAVALASVPLAYAAGCSPSRTCSSRRSSRRRCSSSSTRPRSGRSRR